MTKRLMSTSDKLLLGNTVLLCILAITLSETGILILLNAIPVVIFIYFAQASPSFRATLKLSPIVIALLLLSGGLLWALAAVIFWVLLIELVLYLFPTVLNLVATYFAVRYLPISKIKKIALVLPISILLGINLRLPAMYEVFASRIVDDTTIQKQLMLSPDETLTVESDSQEWRFRLGTFDTAKISVNAIPNVSWHGPQIVVENLEQSLLNSEISFKIGSLSRKHLNIQSHEEGNFRVFDATILEDGKAIAHTHSKKRIRFMLEDVSTGKRSLSDPLMRLSYLLSANVWSVVLDVLEQSIIHDANGTQDRLLEQFLAKAVVLDKSKLPHQQFVLSELANPFQSVTATDSVLCHFSFGGPPTIREFRFNEGEKVTASQRGLGRVFLVFETSEGIKKQIADKDNFKITKAICNNDGVVVIGFEMADNSLDKGIKAAWYSTHGVLQAETSINLPSHDTEIYRRVFEAVPKGNCILLNVSIQKGRYFRSGAEEEFIGYEVCPLDGNTNNH